MPALSITARLDRASLLRLADWLAVGVAVALPWSTTATGILIALWLVAVLPALGVAAIEREVKTAAGGLPVLLWCLGALGMLWADVSWSERLQGLGGFNRLLTLPLLLAQFRRSGQGDDVVRGFFIAAALVLAASFVMVFTPGSHWQGYVRGVPVHDDVFQGSAFLICGFGALGCAADKVHKRDLLAALGLLTAAALFFVNFAFAEISRTSMIVAPLFAVLLGWRLFRWQGILAACAVAVLAGTAFWFASPTVRERLHYSMVDLSEYFATDKATPLGVHVALVRESLPIVASAPIFGHGTGSITDQFRQVTAGQTGVGTVNPHNQTFAVAIQLGAVGALVLWAMWIAHVLLFRSAGIAAWLGTLVVVENIVSSTVHSHLFDFGHGWLYVFGVGVLGGTVLRQRAVVLKPS